MPSSKETDICSTSLYIVNLTEFTNHRPWDTETPSHKISHDKYY